MSTTPFMRDAAWLLRSPAFIRYSDRLMPGEGEDLRQDVAIKAHAYEIRGGEPPRNMSAWLSVIMRHEALRIITSRKSMAHTARFDPAMALEVPSMLPVGRFEGEELVPAGCETDVEGEAAQAIDDGRGYARLHQAIDRLVPQRRAALLNTYWHGIAVRDEKRQGMPFGTVVSTIHRAKDDIAADLAELRRVG